MANDKSSIAFSIYHGGKLTREVSFDRAIINIGKLSTSNLRLNDVNSSRKHAVVERLEDGSWRATDLGSTNGTSLNGKRMTQESLRDGDRLLIGNTTLVVRLEAGDGEVPAGRPRRRAEEIQGLGEDSFYSVGDEEEPDSDDMVLEIALLWGETVLTIEHFNKPETVLVGEETGCRFAIPEEALGVTTFPLIEAVGDQFGLNLALPQLEGDLLVDGSVMPIGELDKDGQLTGHHYVIDSPVRARLRLGEFVLLVSYSRMPARPKLSPLGAIDYNPFIFVSLSAILHIAFLVFLSLKPPEQLISKMDRDARRAKLIEILKIQQPEEEEEEEEEEDERMKAKDKAEDEKPAPETLVDKLNEPKNKKVDLDTLSPEQRKEKAKEMVQDTALAKALSQDTGLLSELLAENDDNMMIDDRLVRTLGSVGGENAPMLAAAGAVDPFSGTLDSGGSRGFASQGSLGAGGGDGMVSKLGKGKKGLDKLKFKERKLTPVAIAQQARVSGRLDRKTVQRIIRQNLSGIKWCYQDALQRNKSLKGKVKLAFTILPNGNVANPNAINPSIKDQKLLSCIKKRMKRWRFPAPKEGGVVKVSYPLLLKTR